MTTRLAAPANGRSSAFEGSPAGKRRWARGAFARATSPSRSPSGPGSETTVSFRRLGHGGSRLYHLRCLPAGFPAYEFDRSAAGGPKFFAVQLADHYAAIFDRNGVPVWWYEASGEADNFQVLADKTITFDPVDEISFQTGDYEVRSLRGKLIRTIRGANGADGGHPRDPVAEERQLRDRLTGATAWHRYQPVRRDGEQLGDRHRDPGAHPRGRARLELGLGGSHRLGGDGPLVVGPVRDRQPALRHQPLELRRDPRPVHVSVLPSPRRRLQGRSHDGRDRLEAGGDADGTEPRGAQRSSR